MRGSPPRREGPAAHLEHLLCLELLGAENQAVSVAGRAHRPGAVVLQSDVLTARAVEAVGHASHCGERGEGPRGGEAGTASFMEDAEQSSRAAPEVAVKAPLAAGPSRPPASPSPRETRPRSGRARPSQP